jgi:predicted RNase H-like HicB family nuclease
MRDKFHKEVRRVKSYLFRVVVEKDEDVWRAYVPELESRGAATWGHSKDEALRNIEEVLQMVVEDLLQEGESLPQSVTVADEPMVAVNV